MTALFFCDSGKDMQTKGDVKQQRKQKSCLLQESPIGYFFAGGSCR